MSVDSVIGPANCLRIALFLCQLVIICSWSQIIAALRYFRVDALPCAFVLTAIISFSFFTIWYLLLEKPPPSDASGVYLEWGRAALNGKLPGEIETSFNPLLPMLFAGLLSVYPDPLVFPAATLLCNALALPIWVGALRRLLAERALRQFAFLYALNPATLSAAAMGQDESIFLLGFALATLFLIRGHASLSGLAFGAAYLCSKFFTTIVAFGFVSSRAKRGSGRLMWTGAFLVIVAPVYLYLGLLGIDLLYPIRQSYGAVEAVSPGNLPFLSSVFNLDPTERSDIHDLLAVLIVVGLAFVIAIKPKVIPSSHDNPLFAGAALMLVFSIVARKSWYEVLIIVPMYCILADRTSQAAASFLWSLCTLLVALNGSLWYWLANFCTFQCFHDADWLSDNGAARMSFFLAFQVAFVAFKTGLLAVCFRPSSVAAAVPHERPAQHAASR